MELLGGEMAPITSEIGFLEAGCEEASRAFIEWQTPLQRDRGVTLKAERVRGTLREVLLRLQPLTSVERRKFLFVPTVGGWTAYFDNGWRGADASSTISTLALQLGCRGLRAVSAPDTIQGTGREAKGRYGAVIFELYGPNNTDFLNYVRTVSIVNDGGSWSFDQSGEPLPFEDTRAFAHRRIQERFTPSMLDRYLHELGISAFDENHFRPVETEGAVLVEKSGPLARNMREYTLKEAREHF